MINSECVQNNRMTGVGVDMERVLSTRWPIPTLRFLAPNIHVCRLGEWSCISVHIVQRQPSLQHGVIIQGFKEDRDTGGTSQDYAVSLPESMGQLIIRM